MEDKKELTRDLLTASFRELMLQIPFEKITIKMITDGAGVIRPTFYKHFQDKYEILEWILQKEIKDKVEIMLDNNMEEDIIRLLCSCLEKDRPFYRKAYEITGQNSFSDLMQNYLYDLFLRLLRKHPIPSSEFHNPITQDTIVRFYTFGFADSLRYWIIEGNEYSAEDIRRGFHHITRYSVEQLLGLGSAIPT